MFCTIIVHLIYSDKQKTPFNEPTLSLEWSLEVFPLAREAGLGGMNVDLKGDAETVADTWATSLDTPTLTGTPFVQIVVQY